MNKNYRLHFFFEILGKFLKNCRLILVFILAFFKLRYYYYMLFWNPRRNEKYLICCHFGLYFTCFQPNVSNIFWNPRKNGNKLSPSFVRCFIFFQQKLLNVLWSPRKNGNKLSSYFDRDFNVFIINTFYLILMLPSPPDTRVTSATKWRELGILV